MQCAAGRGGSRRLTLGGAGDKRRLAVQVKQLVKQMLLVDGLDSLGGTRASLKAGDKQQGKRRTAAVAAAGPGRWQRLRTLSTSVICGLLGLLGLIGLMGLPGSAIAPCNRCPRRRGSEEECGASAALFVGGDRGRKAQRLGCKASDTAPAAAVCAGGQLSAAAAAADETVRCATRPGIWGLSFAARHSMVGNQSPDSSFLAIHSPI